MHFSAIVTLLISTSVASASVAYYPYNGTDIGKCSEGPKSFAAPVPPPSPPSDPPPSPPTSLPPAPKSLVKHAPTPSLPSPLPLAPTSLRSISVESFNRNEKDNLIERTTTGYKLNRQIEMLCIIVIQGSES